MHPLAFFLPFFGFGFAMYFPGMVGHWMDRRAGVGRQNRLPHGSEIKVRNPVIRSIRARSCTSERKSS